MIIWVWVARNKKAVSYYKMAPIHLGLTHVDSHTLWVLVLACLLRVRRKVAESMPDAQQPCLGKQLHWVC